MRTFLTLTLLGLTLPLHAQEQQPPATNNGIPNNPSYVLKVQSDLVLTNVIVRDKHTGAVVRGLTAKDFTVLENGKPQTIQTFDFQSIDAATPLNEAIVSGKAGQPSVGKGDRHRSGYGR